MFCYFFTELVATNIFRHVIDKSGYEFHAQFAVAASGLDLYGRFARAAVYDGCEVFVNYDSVFACRLFALSRYVFLYQSHCFLPFF